MRVHLAVLDHGGMDMPPRGPRDRRGHRDVDQEDRPPAAGLQQPPAQEGRDRGGDPAEAGPCPDRAGAVAWGEGRLDDRQAGRCHQRAADTLHSPRGYQPSDAGRGRAQHRRQREPAQADQEHPPPPPPVAERAGQQDQRGQGQRVARDGPLQCPEAGVQVPSDRGQRDGDHRGVDPRHRRPRDHPCDHPPALRGAVAEQFAWAGAVSRARLARLSARVWCHEPASMSVQAACHNRLAWPPLCCPRVRAG